MVNSIIGLQNPRDAAVHNCSIRLLACVINEGLGLGTLISKNDLEVNGSSHSRYWALISPLDREKHKASVQFLVQLRFRPIVFPGDSSDLKNRPETIKYLHPQDVALGPIFIVQNHKDIAQSQKVLNDLNFVLDTLESWGQQVNDKTRQEINSSVEHLERTYRDSIGKSRPTLHDPPLVWEQSLIEGHPIHPMNKARLPTQNIPEIPDSYDFYRPKVRLFILPKTRVHSSGDYENLISPVTQNLTFDTKSKIVMFVHELQVLNVLTNFPQAELTDQILEAMAESSLRTLRLEALPGIVLKVPLPVSISSLVRINGATSLFSDIGLGSKVLNKVFEKYLDKELVLIHDLAIAKARHDDECTAKHLSVLIRKDTQTLVQERNELFILAAGLTEHYFIPGTDIYAANASNKLPESMLVRTLGLSSMDSRMTFLRKYVNTYIRVFVGVLVDFDFGCEAHLQNTFLRFKRDNDGDLEFIGFGLRDSTGSDFHEAALSSKICIPISGTTNAQVKYQTVPTCIPYHCFFNIHLNSVIRALGLHDGPGSGWRLVYEELDSFLPVDHELRSLWLESNFVKGYKKLLSLKLEVTSEWFNSYISKFYGEIPNLIVYYNGPNNSTHT